MLESMKKDGVLLPASYEFTDTHTPVSRNWAHNAGLMQAFSSALASKGSPAWTQRRAFPSDADPGCTKLRLVLLKLLYWKMPNL